MTNNFTNENYVDFSVKFESLWCKFEDMFPSHSSTNPMIEKTLDAWRTISEEIEKYREENTDYPFWQD